MANLHCPLCCNQTFPSLSLLKSHISDILQNLSCPSCDNKFNSLEDLMEHLEKDCGISNDQNSETIDNGDVSNDAKVIETEQKTEAEEVLEYYCQSCDANFNNFDEHLGKFHEGQEIILEDENGVRVEYPNESDSSLMLLVDQPEGAVEEESEEKVTDKDGRVYTRKFVKIDKFWLDEADEEGNARCEKCGKNFFAENDHECGNNHTCKVCNITFATFKSLRLHRRMHEPMKVKKVEGTNNSEQTSRQIFVCKICHKTYDKEYEDVHMTSHETSNSYNCEICNRKFHTKSNLEMHRKAHISTQKFMCSYCKKPFNTYDALDEHVKAQCQKRKYACQYCGRRFTRPHEKVKHERIHTGEKPHICEICGKAFRVSYCLILHLRTHSGVRPYECKHCGKRFKSYSVYNHHTLTHSDLRAYKCPFCPKAFKTSVQLAGHKNCHIKPFSCTICNRPFAALYAVRAHMETHKKENNLKFECWICGALYSRAFALREHIKMQHRQHMEADGVKAELAEGGEIDAATSILVNEEDIIMGLDGTESIEVIAGEVE